jgi:hypothetical protein
MDRSVIARVVQIVVTLSLISMALAWVSRSAAKRRHLARGTPDRPLLAYPRWVSILGVACTALFSACGWFAWHASPGKGGPGAALVFVGFALLGVVLVVSALADSFALDASGIERLRFGRSRRIAWDELARVSVPWGGQGIRLEARGGTTLEVAELVDGFGLLCDELLRRWPDGARVTSEAGACLLKGATLPPEPLQRAYARCFEAEEGAPPPEMSAQERSVAMGRTFAARMLWRHGGFEPFEARWTAAGAPRITHGEPRGDDPGYAALRLEGREVVLVTDAGASREGLDG